MDILSHGLWGSVIFGRKNKIDFWASFLFGIMPDMLSFGVFTLATMSGLSEPVDWSYGPPPMSFIPQYVSALYNFTHSIVIFLIAFFLIWFFYKKPIWAVGAWGLHIFIDIFTHSLEFFPTPFLWPINGLKINGIPWSEPVIFIPNVIILCVLYLWFFVLKDRKR